MHSYRRSYRRAQRMSRCLFAVWCLTFILGMPAFPAARLADAAPMMDPLPTIPPFESSSDVTTVEALNHLPLGFIPNQGQYGDQTVYSAQAGDIAAYFYAGGLRLDVPLYPPAQSEAELRLAQRNRRHQPQTLPQTIPLTVGVSFVGVAATTVISAGAQLPGAVNDFSSSDQMRWRSDLPQYAQITYQSLYPGIDTVYADDDGALKSSYIVAPGADPTAIRWRYTGVTSVTPTVRGELVLILPTVAGTLARALTETAPIAWQDTEKQRTLVDVAYRQYADGSIGFELGDYDPALPLVIDPTITSVSLSGYASNGVYDVAVDEAGNLYMVGCSGSGGVAFALSADTETLIYRTLLSNCVYTVATGPDGQAFVGFGHTTWLPDGEPESKAWLITLDDAGDIDDSALLGTGYFAGVTNIAYANGRLMVGAYWISTHLVIIPEGGTAIDYDLGTNTILDLAAGPDGSTYIIRYDSATSDVKLVRIDPTGIQTNIALPGALSWAYVAADSDNNMYVAYEPMTALPDGGYVTDLHVRKFDSNGTVLYTTTFNGNDSDGVSGIAVDSATKQVYLAGFSGSTDFPATSGSAPGDVIMRLKADGTLDYSIFIGNNASLNAIVLDSNKIVSAVGYSKLFQVDAKSFSTTVTLTTPGMAIDAAGDHTLTVNADTGWYETPLVTYTIAITNNRDYAQALTLVMVVDGPRTMLIPEEDADDPYPGSQTWHISVAAHSTVTKEAQIWIQPSDQSTLEGTLQVTVDDVPLPAPPPLIDLESVQIPRASVRPVVILPGFISSMPSYFRPNGYQLDPIFQMYAGLVSELEFMGYEDEISIAQLAYPWYGKTMADRNDLADLGNDVKQQLDSWWVGKQAPPYVRTDSFDVISHSTGGLIARYYGSKLGGTSKIHSVFFVATPHLGSPLAYASLEGLDPLQPSWFANLLGRKAFAALAEKAGCYTSIPLIGMTFVSDEHLYTYLRGDPCVTVKDYGAYVQYSSPHPQPGIPLLQDLLPPNLSGVPHYLEPRDGPPVPNRSNAVLEELHALLASFVQDIVVPGGHVYSMMATGTNTITSYPTVHDSIRAAEHPRLWENGARFPEHWKPDMDDAERRRAYTYSTNGDDTVLVASGDLDAIGKNVFGLKDVDIAAIPVDNIIHEKYFNTDSSLRSIVARLIRPDATLFFEKSLPRMIIPEFFNADGIPIEPSEALNILALLVNECPVAMQITDPLGRRIGTTPQGESLNEIPYSYYSGHDLESGPDYLWFPPQTGVYTLTVTGLEPGDFKISGDVISETMDARLGLWTGSLEPGEVMTTTIEIRTDIEHQSVLVVDDHASSTVTELYTSALAANGRQANVWSVAQQGIPSLSDLYPYNTIVWSTGNSTAFSTTSASLLQAYLSTGGHALVTGEDIEATIGGTTAFSKTLGVNVLQVSTVSRMLAGDDLLAGLDLHLNGGNGANNQDSPTSLSVFGDALPLARYVDGDAAGQVAGVRYATSRGRLAYLGFGAEALQTTSEREQVLDRILDWLEIGVVPTVPRLVKDLTAGSSGSALSNLTNVNGTLFFVKTDSTNGTELWKSNGTESGTVLVKDIRPGSMGSNPTMLTVVSNTLFFVANDGTTGVELWKSDGTAAGTVLIKDIAAGSTSSSPSHLVEMQGLLFFDAFDGTSGVEPWTSDGTAAGTTLFKDINAGPGSSLPGKLTKVGSIFFFYATLPGTGTELWKTDGTAVGTALVKDVKSGTLSSTPSNLTPASDQLFFTATTNANGIELWRSDGTETGTILVKDIVVGAGSTSFGPMIAVSHTLFFSANDGIYGAELWSSDGTAGGTGMIKNINPGSAASSPANFLIQHGTIVFSANDGTHGGELWTTDGTTDGTIMVKDINPGSVGATITTPILVDDLLLFAANDGTHGKELWRSAGTMADTGLVMDLNSGTANANPNGFVEVNGRVFFIATTASQGAELWVYEP